MAGLYLFRPALLDRVEAHDRTRSGDDGLDHYNYALGLTRVGPVAFLAGTAVGSLPATVLFLVLGHGAAGVVEGGGGSLGLWATVVLTVLSAVGLTAWAKRRLGAPVAAREVMG